MSAGVNVIERRAQHVTIPIIRLRVSRTRHNCVGTEEASQPGGVETSLVVVDAQSGNLALAGEQLVRVDCTGGQAGFLDPL